MEIVIKCGLMQSSWMLMYEKVCRMNMRTTSKQLEVLTFASTWGRNGGELGI